MSNYIKESTQPTRPPVNSNKRETGSTNQESQSSNSSLSSGIKQVSQTKESK